MATPEFTYQDPFPLAKDTTNYRKIDGSEKYVSVAIFDGKDVVKVDPAALTVLANAAMKDVSFLLRPEHNEQVGKILRDPEASQNDKGVAMAFLRNAEIAANFELPICQDTGTATILGKKGQQIWTGVKDEEYLSKGVYKTYTEENLRYSQTVALDMYREKNTGTNLPAQIDLMATDGDAYKFLFVAKGGGSANKTMLYQETKALLTPERLEKYLIEKMKYLGTAACPPYHIAFVIGGTSADACMKTVKLATAKELDGLPTEGNEHGQAFRDVELENRLLEAAQKLGIGAQFGGKYFAHDVRVIRLPRHGASCPVGMAVSCSADRNIKAKITRDGLFVEEMDRNPGRLIPEQYRGKHSHGTQIDLDRPMKEILADLSKLEVGAPLLLKGTIVVGRDIAHAKFKEILDSGKPLPDYLKNHPIYYAGPAKTPPGKASGSFGPTTAGRMDSYVDLLQENGGSLVMIAKGNRSQQVTDACKKHGGFYLGSIGGPAAVLAEENIKKVKCIDIPEQYRGKHSHGTKIDLDRPMKEILADLSKLEVGAPLLLKGTIVVGRDIAHAKFKEILDSGKPLPDYLKNHPIYYAGPAKTPPGKASGSFGPTTAGRMDSYVDLLQENGGSLVMIAKGNRSQQVTDACKKHGGFYLGSIGGPAAVLAEENIKKVECIDFPELGMEAVWKIEVEDFPAFILVDDKGNDFFKKLGL